MPFMRTVSVFEAKTKLSALLAEVEAGGEVIIARAGTPVARLVAVEKLPARRLGIDDARIAIADDFDVITALDIVIKVCLGNSPLLGSRTVTPERASECNDSRRCRVHHVLGVANLPEYHRNPFDRLLALGRMRLRLSAGRQRPADDVIGKCNCGASFRCAERLGRIGEVEGVGISRRQIVCICGEHRRANLRRNRDVEIGKCAQKDATEMRRDRISLKIGDRRV